MAARKNSLRSILVTVLLCVALGGVIYAMHYTQGYQFRKGLEVFFNPSAPTVWNWCPADAEKVEFLGNHDEKNQPTLAEICKVTVEPVAEEKAARKLSRFLSVSSPQATKVLEADESLEVFRVDGLVFQSQALSKTLKHP